MGKNMFCKTAGEDKCQKDALSFDGLVCKSALYLLKRSDK